PRSTRFPYTTLFRSNGKRHFLIRRHKREVVGKRGFNTDKKVTPCTMETSVAGAPPTRPGLIQAANKGLAFRLVLTGERGRRITTVPMNESMTISTSNSPTVMM